MAKVKKGSGAAKEKAVRAAVRHHEKAPCSQGFSVDGKPGKKKASWWNGVKPVAPKAVAD